MTTAPIGPSGRPLKREAPDLQLAQVAKDFYNNPFNPSLDFLPEPQKLPSDFFSPPHLSQLLDTTIHPQHGKNKATQKNISTKTSSLFHFAKNHPVLTAGFILGVLLILCAFPVIGSTFYHVAGLTVLHAKLALGLGLGAVLIYYGVYLINLSRRAALKDLYESQIQNISESQSKKIDLSFPKAKRKQIVETSKKLATYVERNALEEIQSKKKQQIDQLAQWQKSADAQLSQYFQTASPQLIGNVTKNVVEGTGMLLEYLQSKQQIVAPLFSLDHLLEIPEISSKETEEKKELQQKMASKLGDLLSSFGESIKKNPGSALIFTAGFFFTLVAAPALIYFFAGRSSAFLIGSLSLGGGLQFIIYGGSLLYEGQNSMEINRIRKKLQELEKQSALQAKESEKVLQTLSRIEEQAKMALLRHRDNWKQIAQEQTLRPDLINAFIENEKRKKLADTIKNELRLEVIHFSPNGPSSQAVNDVFLSLEAGAAL